MPGRLRLDCVADFNGIGRLARELGVSSQNLIMSICKRIADAQLLFQNGRHEGAFLSALVAVAATARREDPDRRMKDRECFEAFLNKKKLPIKQIEFRGKLNTIPHILYKWFRCELVHEGGLPIDVEFIESEALSIRAGGAPSHVLKISYGWFYWLLEAVVQAPCNKDEFKKIC